MMLDEWARKWMISPAALEELKLLFGVSEAITPTNKLSEGGVQSLVRLEASVKGARLWRNNVGATYTDDGNFLRFGLANDSTDLNKILKSSDLIGIRPRVVTPAMVGVTIGQFLSREIKPHNWKYRGTDREVAQLNWIKLINSFGGDASFATGEGTL